MITLTFIPNPLLKPLNHPPHLLMFLRIVRGEHELRDLFVPKEPRFLHHHVHFCSRVRGTCRVGEGGRVPLPKETAGLVGFPEVIGAGSRGGRAWSELRGTGVWDSLDGHFGCRGGGAVVGLLYRLCKQNGCGSGRGCISKSLYVCCFSSISQYSYVPIRMC